MFKKKLTLEKKLLVLPAMSIHLEKWTPEGSKLMNCACCVVGWAKSGKTTLCCSISAEIGAHYFPNDFNIVFENDIYIIETEGLSRQAITETSTNPKQKCLIESCQSFTATNPDARPYFQYIFICGRLSDRELERIFDVYKHFLPFSKTEFLAMAEYLCDYRCLVIDVSFELRVGKRQGRVYWYLPKLE